jgi:hypothetical protein
MSEKAAASEPADSPSPTTKPKHFKEQFDEEDVLLVFRKHPIVMRLGLILAMLGILAGMIPALIKPEYSYFFLGLLGGFILGLILIFPWWVRWYFSVYIMTSHRFIQQTRSLLSVNVVDISLDQVQMINYQIKGLEQTLLNYGTIIVQTYVGDLVIRNVHRPARIQKKMIHILRDLGIHPAQRPGTDNDDQKVIENQ